VSLALHISGEPLPDVVPLTSAEKTRKAELESVIAHGLEEFLRVGQALAELRNRRLYRAEHVTFEQYVQSRFGLHRSAVDGVIRSAQTAQVLLDAGLQLPPDVTATVLRPVSGLPGEDLQIATWQYVQLIAPQQATQPVVARICRTIRNVLDGDEGDDDRAMFRRAHYKARSAFSPARERSFVAPLLRLSSWQGFNLELVLSHAGKFDTAKALYQACTVMQKRCGLVCARLEADYPELSLP
jgi:hypothetical protein